MTTAIISCGWRSIATRCCWATSSSGCIIGATYMPYICSQVRDEKGVDILPRVVSGNHKQMFVSSSANNRDLRSCAQDDGPFVRQDTTRITRFGQAVPGRKVHGPRLPLDNKPVPSQRTLNFSTWKVIYLTTMVNSRLRVNLRTRLKPRKRRTRASPKSAWA